MRKICIVFLMGLSLLAGGGCTDEGGNSLSGSIIIKFLNETVENEPELFVVSGIFENTTATNPLRELERGDVGGDKDFEILVEELLPGSYSLKYRLEIPSTNFIGAEMNKAFQIFAGEQKLLNVEL